MTRLTRARVLASIVALSSTASLCLHAQAVPYPEQDLRALYAKLFHSINQILLFDNHSHPGFADDPDVDAMASPPGSSALRIRADNPELVAASKALFGYPYADFSLDHTRWLVDRRSQLRREKGDRYFADVLDQLGIETAVANRVAMPAYLDKRRFLWAFFVDSFLFPFDNNSLRDSNTDEQVYIPLQEKILARELQQAGLAAKPPSLDGYLQFISRVLESDRTNGGVAIKFEAAYFRSLHFGDPTQAQAAALYERYKDSGKPTAEEYTIFQDFIFRYLLREAGKLHLAVHFHSSVGIGDFFSLHNGNVLNLENVLRDPRYDSVTFVLLHGGFPYDREAIWLAARKNVFLDSSLVDLYLYPSEFKSVLKYWLSIFPDKVLFGSDAFPFNDALGAEEAYWLSVQSSREALAAALAELVSERAFTEAQAMKIAHGYLHDNAAHLYRTLRGL